MQPRIYYCILACAAVIFVGCKADTVNEKEASAKDKHTENYGSLDDLYLDDQDALEGSGRGGGEVRDDLEASGSGRGPDDEDGDGEGNGGSDYDNPGTFEKNTKKEPSTPVVINNPTYIEDPHKVNQNITDFTPKRPTSNGNLPDNEDISGEDNEDQDDNHEVLIMNPKHEDRASSFFAQPGVLAAVIGGAVVGLLCAILVVMFIVYRMRKKDEGSYALDEPRRSPAAASYPKPGAPHHNREFYA